MRRLVIAPFLIILLAPLAVSEPGSTAHFSATFPPSMFGDKTLPVMLVHGYDGTFDAANDGTRWDDAISTFKAMGWTGTFRKWAFYGCDDLSDEYAYSMNTFGVHGKHYGGSSSHETSYSCGKPHNRYAPIEHLAYHFAWAVQDKFTSKDKCVVAIGHSMGGLIIRYAVAQVEYGHADFPSKLCIKSVVTWGTPHAGSDWGGQGNCITTQRCEMMPGSSFLEWLAAYAPNPQGTGGTEWTVIGSETDDFVSALSAMSMDAPHRVVYQEIAGVEHGAETDSHETTYLGRASASQGADVQYWNDWHGSSPPTSDGYWNPVTTSSGYWPVMWAAYSLAYGDWGCGGSSYPWPIPKDSLIFGERPLSGKNCNFKIVGDSSDTDLVVQMATPANGGLTMAVTGASDPQSCNVATTSVDKLCHLQDVTQKSWNIRTTDGGQFSTPFAVRATMFRNQAPTLTNASCAPAEIVRGRPMTCTFVATDDSPGLVYHLAWGDGTASTTVPSTGKIAPGMPQTTTHSWPSRGIFNWSVTATDDAPKNPRSSSPRTGLVTVWDFPGPPQALSATAGPDPGEIQVEWARPADEGGTPVTAYRIYRAGVMVAEQPAGVYVGHPAPSGGTADHLWYAGFTDSNLTAGERFSYQVSAVTRAGEGPPSLPAEATTWSTPGAPQQFVAAYKSPGVVVLSWEPPFDNGGISIRAYRVYRGIAPGNLERLEDVTATSLVDANSPSASVIYYAISALNIVGEGSQTVSLQPFPHDDPRSDVPDPPPSEGIVPSFSATPAISAVLTAAALGVCLMALHPRKPNN